MTNQILHLVSDHFSVPLTEMLQRSRKAEYVRARFTASYLLRKHTPLTYREIAQTLYPHLPAKNVHATVINAERKILQCLQLKDWIYRDVEQIEARLFHTKAA
jgi:chromosomal replication initiation ATPase DnaA